MTPSDESPRTTILPSDCRATPSCDSGSITLGASASGCDADLTCSFDVQLSNRSTGAIYSDTPVTITMDGSIERDVTPDLDAATIPLCSAPAVPCQLTETCTKATDSR